MPTPRLKPKQTVLEQQQHQHQYGSYYILKWLTEEEFWKLGRHAFFKALKEANNNEQAKRGVGR